MNCYRITKYNPKFRDEKGCYLAEEWTSISDVGKIFNTELFTMEKYLKVENSYIRAIETVLSDSSVTKLFIVSLEIYDDTKISDVLSDYEIEVFHSLRDGMQINLNEIKIVVKLVLREVLWCKLCSFMRKIEIEFGYDYYMYIKIDSIERHTMQKLLSYGLFVEIKAVCGHTPHGTVFLNLSENEHSDIDI